MTASADHDQWDDPKYLDPGDCDALGYCLDCGSATVHKADCVTAETTHTIGSCDNCGADVAHLHGTTKGFLCDACADAG